MARDFASDAPPASVSHLCNQGAFDDTSQHHRGMLGPRPCGKSPGLAAPGGHYSQDLSQATPPAHGPVASMGDKIEPISTGWEI